jgi:hypothetical protein
MDGNGNKYFMVKRGRMTKQKAGTQASFRATYAVYVLRVAVLHNRQQRGTLMMPRWRSQLECEKN